jgi:hypothetical protein
MPIISVQPDLDETAAVRQVLLQIVTTMGDQLVALANSNDPAYLALRAQQQELTRAALALETRQLELVETAATGAAVDAINAAISAIQAALAREARLTADVKVMEAFVDFIGALLAGQPQAILAAGRTLQPMLKF